MSALPWNDPPAEAPASVFDAPEGPRTQQAPNDLFERYARAGFEVDLLPIIPPDGELAPGTSVTDGAKSKTPGAYHRTEGTWRGRAKWNDRDATAAELKLWSTWPRAGIGIRTKRIAGIDIDVTLESLANEIEKLAIDMLGDAPCRIGNAPKRLLAYRVALPGKLRIEAKHEDSGDVQAVEILADGQQFVAEGTHAKTGKPYQWHRGSPLALGLDGLPAVDREGVQAFRTAVAAHLEKVLQPLGYKIAHTESGGGAKAEDNAVPLTTEVDAEDLLKAYGLIKDAGRFAESGRHDGILRVAFEIKDLIGDRDRFNAVMDDAWQQCAPDYPHGEYVSTRDSVWTGGQNRPGSKSQAVLGPDAQFSDTYEAFVDADGRKVAPASPEEAAKLTLGVFIGDRYVGPAAKRKHPAASESAGSAKGTAAEAKGGDALPPLTPAEWRARDLPEPDYLLGSWLHTTSRAIIAGATGVGKTNFGLALAAAMAAGKPFLNWPSRRASRVLYIDGEMSRRLLKQRVLDACRRSGDDPETLYTLSHEDAEGFQPLDTKAGQAFVDNFIKRIGGVDFIVFDNIMCLLEGDMNKPESWKATLPWVLSLTKRGIGQGWFHHTGHDESRSYGDKSKEWGMDTVLHLTSAKRDGVDVSFDLSFRKARERTPDNRIEFADIHVALAADAWTWKAAEKRPAGKTTPLDVAFRAALVTAMEGSADRLDGYPAVRMDQWREACVVAGLLDRSKPDGARALFSRHRRNLVAAGAVHVADDLVRLTHSGPSADDERWFDDEDRLS